MDELLEQFYASNLDGSSVDEDRPVELEADNSMGNAFSGGLTAGTEGMGASIDYFQALLGTAVGADEFAEKNIAEAEFANATGRAALAGVEEFGEFLEEPTVGGAFTQIAKAGGQGLPSLLYSIGTLATGGVLGAAGGALARTSSKKAAKRLIDDATQKVLDGSANPRDLELAQAAYDLTKKAATRKGAKFGSYAGLAAGEYPSLAGENFSEALGAGQNRDLETALQSALVAVPQAAIGVGTEVAFLKVLGKSAASRSTGEGSVFGQLASNIGQKFGRGAGLEGASEYAQTEIAIQNRLSYDPDYSQEERNLRRMESAFAGAVVGGFAGGVGGTVSTLYQNRGAAAEKAAPIFEKSRKLWEDSIERRQNDKIDEEEAQGAQAPQSEFAEGQVVTVLKGKSGPRSAVEADDGSILTEREITPDEVTIIKVKKDDNGDTVYLGRTEDGQNITWSDSQLADGSYVVNPPREYMEALQKERADRLERRRAEGEDQRFRDEFNARMQSEMQSEQRSTESSTLVGGTYRSTRTIKGNPVTSDFGENETSVDDEGNRKTTFNKTRSDGRFQDIGVEVPLEATIYELDQNSIDVLTESGIDVADIDVTVVEIRENSSGDVAATAYVSNRTGDRGAEKKELTLKKSGTRTSEGMQSEERSDDLFAPENLQPERTPEEKAAWEADRTERAAAYRQKLEEAEVQRKAAQRKKRQAQAKKNFSADPEDGLLAAIVAAGGISRSSVERDGSQITEAFKTARVKGRSVFRKEGGLQLDDMVTALRELGYYNDAPQGRPDNFGANDLLDDLVNALADPETPYFTAVKGPTEQSLEDAYNEYYGNEQDDEPTQRSMETFTPTDAEGFSQKQLNLGGPTNRQPAPIPVSEPKSTRPQKPDLEPKREEFRATVGENLTALVAEDPDNARLVALEKQYREGDNARKDEILGVLYAEKQELQKTRPDARDEEATMEEVQDYFQGQGFQENVETIETKGYSRKKDPEKTFKNTEASRAQFEEAFGKKDWSDPFYAHMTESFLRRAAEAKMADVTAEGDPQSDFKIVATEKGYVLEKTSFIKDPDALDDQFVLKTLRGAKRSQFAAGSGVELIEAGLEPKEINLVNLTDAGRELVRQRGNSTYQGDKLAEMARQGLPEFITEITELNVKLADEGKPTFDIRIQGKSIFDITSQDLLGPIGDVVAARADGADVQLRDVLGARGQMAGSRIETRVNPGDNSWIAKAENEIDLLESTNYQNNLPFYEEGDGPTPQEEQELAKLARLTERERDAIYAKYKARSKASVLTTVVTDRKSDNFVSVEFTDSFGEQYSVRRENNRPDGKPLTLETAKKEVARLERDGFKPELRLTPKNSAFVVTATRRVSRGEAVNAPTLRERDPRPSELGSNLAGAPQPASQARVAQIITAKQTQTTRAKAVDEALARDQFTEVENVEEYFYSAEEADAYATRLRDTEGFDNVTVKDPVVNEGANRDTEQGLGDEVAGMSTANYNKDGFDAADPDLPKTRLNLEMNPRRDVDRSLGGKNRQTYGRQTYRGAEYPFGSLGTISTEFVTKTIAKIKPKKPVIVIGLSQLKKLTPAKIAEQFNDPQVAAMITNVAAELASNNDKRGEYIGFTNAHVALIDDISVANDLQTALISAHEALGHVLFNEEIEGTLANPALRKRLERDFEKARTAPDAPAQYQTEHGFEEWFADQTAITAKNIYIRDQKQPNGVVGRTFAKIAEKLKAMWDSLSAEFKRRFGKDSYSKSFDDYIENTIIKERAHLRQVAGKASREVAYSKKSLVRAMEESITKNPDAQQSVNSMLRNFKDHIDGTAAGHTMFKMVLPEDNILRGISPVIADMMYARSNAKSRANNQFGYLKSKDHVRGQVYDQLEKILGTNWESKEIQDAFELAADQDKKTEALDGKAREIRDWLNKFYDDYIAKTPGNEIAKREDYFPVALDLAAIFNNETRAIAEGAPETTFTELVIKYNPLANEETIRQAVSGLVARQQSIVNDNEITFDAQNPQSVVEKARVLTQNIPHSELKPFIEKPEVALMKYIRHVITRSEWKRNTHDADGNDMLASELAKLPEAKRKEAVTTLERYLGYTDKPLNPRLSKAMSWMQLFNWVTLLPLATIGSIPEFGGAIVNTKEFNGFGMAKNAILSRIQNPEQAIQLARTLGVTHSTVMGNLGLTEADAEYLDPRVRKYSDAFFSKIGLDYFTRYTREFASVMSVEFLVEHAYNKTNNDRASRYLKDHGVTAEQVKSWLIDQVDGAHYTFEGEAGKAVMGAMQRFVDNSMLKPNAAERTSWGNDPKYQLIWALKSYLFSFGKVILGGVKREMQMRLAEGDTTLAKLSSVGMMGLLTAAAFMPLAALSLELREIAKAGIAGVLPGVEANARYFRSDRMDIMTYMGELFDRGGLAGPLAVFGMVGKSAEWGESQGLGPIGQTAKALSPIFGPTYGFLVDDIALGLYSGKGWDVVPARIIPGYSLVL